MRSVYLVCYDVSDDKRLRRPRRRLHRVLGRAAGRIIRSSGRDRVRIGLRDLR